MKETALATSNASRSRPAFEKLVIGPAMIFGEMITGGHYLEVLTRETDARLTQSSAFIL